MNIADGNGVADRHLDVEIAKSSMQIKQVFSRFWAAHFDRALRRAVKLALDFSATEPESAHLLSGGQIVVLLESRYSLSQAHSAKSQNVEKDLTARKTLTYSLLNEWYLKFRAKEHGEYRRLS